MNADALAGESATQAGTPRGPRVAVVISVLISFVLIAVNIRTAMGPPNMINVEVPWLGLTEAGILLLAAWPAWRGQLWAVSVQTGLLLFVVFHSYWLLITDRWLSGGNGFVSGNSAAWRTGFGEGYLIVMLPYFVVIVSEAAFIIRRLQVRPSTTLAIAHTDPAASRERAISANARPGGKSTPLGAPVSERVVLAITALIAAEMTGLLWPGGLWEGVPEGVALLVLFWPAWKGQLWAISAQAALLLIAVFHSSFSFYSRPNPFSGLGGYYLLFLAPLFVLILFDTVFVVLRFRSRPAPKD